MSAGVVPAFECHLCGAAATQSCGGCGALFYCGDAHRAAHWQGGHGGAECARLAADVAEGAALRAALPFPWADEAATAVEAQRDTACAFLTRRGVHNTGLWRRECACGTAGPFGACSCRVTLRALLLTPTARRLAAAARPRRHARRAVGAAARSRARRLRGRVSCRRRGAGAAARLGVVLRDPARALRSCQHLLVYALTVSAIHARRGLPLESVAAVCLDAALTLTHALAVAAVPIPRVGQLVVHLIGARRELDALPSASPLAHAHAAADFSQLL